MTEGAPPSIQGQNGDHTLFNVICVLKDYGISEHMAVELLDKHYNVPGRCEPQWNVGRGPDADNLAIKVRNAYRYGQNAAGVGSAEAAFASDPVDAAEVAALDVSWRKREQDQEQAKLRARFDRQEHRKKRRASPRKFTGPDA